MYLGQQFPKVTSLTFTISKFDPATVTVGDIFKAFPKLTELSLDGHCDFKDFSGISNVRSADYERHNEYIPRQKSITDFLELETIVFGPSFVVDPDMVRYCLRRVPKLKEVSLHWVIQLSSVHFIFDIPGAGQYSYEVTWIGTIENIVDLLTYTGKEIEGNFG
ncbi:unnamed protein product [Allacma fusca]|uniref:Uncharacterized protein n=1 Tax=Allacma fusca TaxID=39272 RepID=A0A8J2PEN1_9HEXA|nr:unnamed protein product [Allacma fusca]